MSACLPVFKTSVSENSHKVHGTLRFALIYVEQKTEAGPGYASFTLARTSQSPSAHSVCVCLCFVSGVSSLVFVHHARGVKVPWCQSRPLLLYPQACFRWWSPNFPLDADPAGMPMYV